MFVLMERKTQALYTAIYARCKEIAPSFEPTQALADFERANYIAMEETFANIEFSGYIFLVCQLTAN